VQANVWIGGEDTDEYWAEGVTCTIDVEATDADEVRLGVRLHGEATDVVTLYVSRSTADELARYIAAASVIPVWVP